MLITASIVSVRRRSYIVYCACNTVARERVTAQPEYVRELGECIRNGVRQVHNLTTQARVTSERLELRQLNDMMKRYSQSAILKARVTLNVCDETNSTDDDTNKDNSDDDSNTRGRERSNKRRRVGSRNTQDTHDTDIEAVRNMVRDGTVSIVNSLGSVVDIQDVSNLTRALYRRTGEHSDAAILRMRIDSAYTNGRAETLPTETCIAIWYTAYRVCIT